MYGELDQPVAPAPEAGWWAVDRYGHVAWFASGEEGPVPEGVDPQRHLLEDLEQPLPGGSSLRWFRGESPDPHAGPPPFHRDPEGETPYFHYLPRGGAPVEPYQRGQEPAQPWRLGQAHSQPLSPSELDELASRGWVVFPGLDFRREVLLQPFEHLACGTWGGHRWISTVGGSGWVAIYEELDPRTPARSELSLEPLPADPAPVRLALSYLRGDEGSARALADWLADRGSPAPCPADTLGERLDELVWIGFDPQRRAQLEREAVAHLLETLDPESPARTAALREILEKGRDPEHSSDLADEASDLWHQLRKTEPRAGQAAWAVWALLEEMPLVPSRTARAVEPAELSWQIQQVLRHLGRPAPGERAR